MSDENGPVIELTLEAKARRIDGFDVGRALPSALRRAVGPFVFVDHIGPSRLAPGSGLDVRPHPHIHLATVTYLFSGEILHRDSLGSEQVIAPGAINWMTAGRGIVHSERSPQAAREDGAQLHGLQLWIALPEELEDSEPRFSHHPASTLPELREPGSRVRVLAGEAYGATAPVPVSSPLFYVEALLEPSAHLHLPDHEERAAYVIDGDVHVLGSRLPDRSLVIFRKGASVTLHASSRARVMLLGGAALGPRYMFWNFVSSKKERIEQAARQWRAGEFPKVPGDEHEHIPLDIEPHFANS